MNNQPAFIQIRNVGNMYRVYVDGVTRAFATTYVVAQQRARQFRQLNVRGAQ